jgi:hypothetical protein
LLGQKINFEAPENAVWPSALTTLELRNLDKPVRELLSLLPNTLDHLRFQECGALTPDIFVREVCPKFSHLVSLHLKMSSLDLAGDTKIKQALIGLLNRCA